MIDYKIKHDNILCVGDKGIDFKHNILHIIELDKLLVILLLDSYEKKGYLNAAEQPLNNVYAINKYGDIVWNIKDLLVEDTRYPNMDKEGLYTRIEKLDDGTLRVTEFSGSQPIIDVGNRKVLKYSFTK
jgi:hypothetical protein